MEEEKEGELKEAFLMAHEAVQGFLLVVTPLLGDHSEQWPRSEIMSSEQWLLGGERKVELQRK